MKFLQKLPFLKSSHTSGEAMADEQDVYYCYRLFLHREPDAGGFAYWRNLVQQGMTLRDLTRAFMEADEFAELCATYNRVEKVELEQFSIYVNPDDYGVGGVIKRHRAYEPVVTAELRQLLTPGQIFIDVGANIGYLSLQAAERVGSHGRVIAFEPNGENCQLFAKSIAANQFAQIELHQLAVDAKQQTLRLTSPGSNSNGRILASNESTSDEVLIEAIALDEFLPPLPHIDLVKIDIEGAEPRAVAGMARLLQQHRPKLIFEFTPSAIRQLCEIEPETFLEQLQQNYQLFILDPVHGRSAKPLKTAEIMKVCQQSGAGSHADILALPL